MFKNRQDAGQQLAKKLKEYKDKKEVLILGLPRGGVVVAKEIAKKLKLSLDVVIPRKLGAPANPEFAIGAVSLHEVLLNPEIDAKTIEKKYLDLEVKVQRAEIKRRLRLYRGQKKPSNLKDKTVIVVDDGIATGMTLKAAIAEIKIQKPKKIIAAIPVAPASSISEIKKITDKVICLETPKMFWAVGQFYEEFDQTIDQEVIETLKSIK